MTNNQKKCTCCEEIHLGEPCNLRHAHLVKCEYAKRMHEMVSPLPREEGKECCDECYSTYTSDDIPREFYDACVNLTCKCHATKTPGDMECGFDCHIQEPYGFVPEEGCTVHDAPIKKTVKNGIDFSKDNIYDAIGRPDLKPTPTESWERDFKDKFYWDGNPMGLSSIQVSNDLIPYISLQIQKAKQETLDMIAEEMLKQGSWTKETNDYYAKKLGLKTNK